jgi:hypothetical protein
MVTMPTKETLAAGKMENCFRDGSDLVEQYLIDGEAGMSGAAPIAIIHLICRSIADLRSAQYLASSGFTVQMYSLVRPVIESINLVDLFVQEPTAADEWMAGEHWKIKPAVERTKLGLGDDDLYSWACAHSHPRFAGMQLTTYTVTNNATGKTTVQPFIGGLPLEFPSVLMATTFPGNILCLLSQSLAHATVKEEVAKTWPTVARSVGENLLPGFQAVYEALEAHGLPEAESAKLLGSVKQAITSAAELEAMHFEDQTAAG